MKTLERLDHYRTALQKWKDARATHPEVPEPKPEDYHLLHNVDKFLAKTTREQILGKNV